MAETEETEGKTETAPSRTPSLAAFAGVIIGLTALGAGSGYFMGMQFPSSSASPSLESKADVPERKSTEQNSDKNANLITLTPIIANLADPSTAWVRIEATVVSSEAASADTKIEATKVSEDIVALMKTMSLSDIQGPRGFQNLREDLNDRIRTRSDGKFRDLIIHGFVVE
jgi:flagellar FliL protein